MITKYLYINNGICNGYSDNPTLNTIKYTFNSEDEFYNFKVNMIFYRYENGQLFYDENLKIAYDNTQINKQKEDEFNDLIYKRESLFKKYVDRSPMFYEKLTPEQKQELQVWYNIWCDMPITFENGTWVEPPIPEWLKPYRSL